MLHDLAFTVVPTLDKMTTHIEGSFTIDLNIRYELVIKRARLYSELHTNLIAFIMLKDVGDNISASRIILFDTPLL